MRLARFIAECGIASRRQAEVLISEGAVSVNGESVTSPATVIDEILDSVVVNGKKLEKPKYEYVKFYKPRGFTCAKTDNRNKTIYDYLGKEYLHLNYVGRLDKESEGLLLMTNDGELLHALTHPSFEVPRTYRVTTNTALQKKDIERMYAGIEDEEELLKCDHIRIKTRVLYELTLHTGRKREIRRMITAVGKKVVSLVRIEYAGVTVGDLAEGEIRPLREKELSLLRSIL